MNKLIKQLSFFSLLLIFFENYSTERFFYDYFNKKSLESDYFITPQKVSCMITCSAGIIAAIYFYIHNYISFEDVHYLSQKYPHANVWYQSLIKKYNHIDFDKKILLSLSQDPDRYVHWDYFYRQIYCHEKILENINPIYRKKTCGFLLSQEENIFLSLQEFLFLCQVGHIENNHIVKSYIGYMSLLMSIESIKAYGFMLTNDAYKKLMYNSFVNPWQDLYLKSKVQEKLLEFHVLGFLPELILFCLYAMCIEQHQFVKSHRFACRYADMYVLNDVLLFLKEYLTSYYEENFAADYKQDFFADPMYSYRVSDLITMIEEEIALRLSCQNEQQ